MAVNKKNSGDPLPWEYVYTFTFVELVFKDEKVPGRLTTAKLDALRKVAGIVETYEKYDFNRKIVDAIMEKKAKMLLEATTHEAIQEIVSLPKPYYDGTKWHVSKYSVPEEELVLWSIASAKAPLIPEAVDRYLAVFKQVYGYDPIDHEK